MRDEKHNSKQNKKLNKQKQDSTCSDGKTLNDESIKSKVKKKKKSKNAKENQKVLRLNADADVKDAVEEETIDETAERQFVIEY